MDKIYAGVVVIFIIAAMGGAIYSDYLKSECRLAMAEQKYPADDIARACR